MTIHRMKQFKKVPNWAMAETVANSALVEVSDDGKRVGLRHQMPPDSSPEIDSQDRVVYVV